MEDCGNIGDESLPSLLGASLSSGALGNVTGASNPGPPVAASTVAKSRTGCDHRLSDVQASYLEEGRRSLASGSPRSIQSDADPVGRFALSFQDDLEVDTQIKEPQLTCAVRKESRSLCGEEERNVMEHSNHSDDTLVELLPLEQLEDLSTGICFLPGSKNNKVGTFEPSEKLIEGEILSEHLSASLSSFLENEKLSSIASLGGDSTDDDIDDEEFFDNQLEAYFEQLVPPEMARGDTSMQELSKCCTALKLSENGLIQENFQAVAGRGPGNASDENSQKQGVAGCSVEKEMLPRTVQQLHSMAGGDGLDSCSAAELKLDSLYLQCTDSHKADVWGALPTQEIKSPEARVPLDAEVLHPTEGVLGYCTSPKIPVHTSVVVTDADAAEGDVGLADTYLSPSAGSCEEMGLPATDKGDTPHSIVYQNEEGKWVTDLAYYTSFDEEQDLNLSEEDKINEEFITGAKAAAMIAQDQEEFEKAHRLVQAEKGDFLNASEVAESSWRSANSCFPPRTSELSKDASYLRLSLGEFFGQRSEALGCLGGGSDVKRPSFGYYITSPKKREPVALLRQSDTSGDYAGQESSHFFEVFPDDLGAPVKEHTESANCEKGCHGREAAAGIHKNFSTETATKSTAKAGFPKGKLEESSSEHSDSVLSISTIASAIANASASTEPAQLAAMMMALSNKSKKKCFLPGVADGVEPAAKPASSSRVENSTFDMEKYLKKTDEMGRESDCESIVKHEASVQNLIYDSFLVDKNKHTPAEDLLYNHNKQQEVEKQFVGYLHEEAGIQNFSCLSSVPKDEDMTANSTKCSAKVSDLISGKHSQTVRAPLVSDMLDTPNRSPAGGVKVGGTPSATAMEVACRGQCACRGSLLAPACSKETPETGDEAADAVPEIHDGLLRRMAGSAVSLNILRTTEQSSTHVSVSPTTVKPVQRSSSDEKKQGGKTQKRSKDAGGACSGNVKHVTFEKPSVTSQNSSAEHKPVLPECDFQSAEDDQCSFRPSTSPLIHSSPSDTSGTTFSGSETDFACASYCQKPRSESALPHSVYSSPSMSRLTYVSASDSTLKNTVVMHNPDVWVRASSTSESDSELSTTIIQGSPTPSLEHKKENLNNYSSPRKGKETLYNIEDKSEEKELVSLINKLESEKLSKKGFPANENQAASNPSNVTSNHKELDHITPALPSKSCLFPALSDNADKPEVWQDRTSKAQRPGLPSFNSIPIYPGLSGYIPLNQNSSEEQYVPISSFKSHATVSESQASSSVPTLLTGCSLATTPFAQQHLGSIPAAGSAALSQFRGGTSAGFSLPGGLPGAALPAGRAPNPVASGVPLGPSIGPGSLGAASLCNPHSAWNKNILNIKPYADQPFGVGRNEWESSVSPAFGHVKVPEELKFPHACCVGIASQTTLSIFNPTERWLQASIGIISISVNGEKMDPTKYQCLVFKNKTIVGPHSTDDLKILFLPCHSGIFQCILSVSSWPVSADAETIVQAEALASRVVLTGVAEHPHIEVEKGKTECLDFGDLTSGSWKALPLKLINKTHAFVPIRLIINANAVAWRCFTFSKEPVNPNEHSFPMDAVTPIAAPSVVNHVIHASYDGQDPEALTVWVLFHAPKKQISSSDSLGPAEEFLARVDVEVDSPGPSSVIKSIPLRARAGTARIHAPKDLQTISLSASVGSSSKQQLPLKNAGNIGVHLKVKISNQDSCFSVEPENLFLRTEEEQEVTVQFSPKNLNAAESTLKILVLPSGPQYEVVLKGEVGNGESRPVFTAAQCTDIPPILSNKQFVAWGGVALGRSVQQKLTLRNNSLSATQHLRLVIRGQDQDCFQLQSIFGSEERLSSNWELKIRPKEDTNIYLMFTPTRITCMFAKLEIKQLGIRSQPGIKFTIPLSGYGGTSNIILENVKKLSGGYLIKLDKSSSARLRKVSFRIRNTGSRAAYVRALCFADLETKTIVDPHAMMMNPEKFVLNEGTHEVITVTWKPVEKENLHKTNSLISAVCIFWGDEISRRQYRRAMMYNPQVEKHIVPENSLVRNVKFDEEFPGEQLVTEVCEIPRRSNDIHLFYGNMQKIVLCVVGCSPSEQDDLQQSPQCHLASERFGDSGRHINATLDVLPVKGPQGPPLHVKIGDIIQNILVDQQTWAVTPEYLILTPPSINGTADTGHVQIINNSSRMLQFELSWPAHCLTITPQHGNVEPESSILILVSPNPSLATKPSVIPWSGLIYIHCDNRQKFVKVQIRDAGAKCASEEGSPSRKLDIFMPPSESPVVHVAKPLSMPSFSTMEIKKRTVIFPNTRAGESSESYLEMENKGDENLKWHLSSFAPPYVKDVDESGHVYRVTYSAFRCSRVSGTLEAHGKEKVSLTFLPRDRGDYSQFWDLECYPVENPPRKHKLRFQLSGEGIKTENKTLKTSTDALTETELPPVPARKAYSEASAVKAGQNGNSFRGLYAPEDFYTFPPTRVGETRTLKINLRNNSFSTHLLRFVSPGEPFHIKHLRYSLRSHHYINVPVQFKPKAEGRFESLLVVQTNKHGCLGVRLCGKALPPK